MYSSGHSLVSVDFVHQALKSTLELRLYCSLHDMIISSSDYGMYALEQKPAANRTRVEILANILQVASNRTLKTHIMYRANLSHRQLEKYLTFLETNGMLERLLDEDGVLKYRVTQRGIDFLKDYERLSSYLS